MYKTCDNLLNRLKGFMFVKKKLPYGLYFPNCSSIHTFFCFQTLSVYFLDKKGNVLVHEYIKPGKVRRVKKAFSVLEFSLDTVNEPEVLSKIKSSF